MGISVLLFDLGGVLVDWAGIGAVAELTSGRMGVDSTRRYWLSSEWVRGFESGRCAVDAFCSGVVGDLELPLPPGEFLQRFLSWDRGPLPGALELLDNLRPQFTLACMSNNNPLHWERLRPVFAPRFHHIFLSYETGLMKPDTVAFDHVLVRLGCPAEEVLFFDDSPECVEGARAVGIRGHMVQGVPAVLKALASEGIHVTIPTAESVQKPE